MKRVGKNVTIVASWAAVLLAFQLQAQDGNYSFGWANYDGQTEKGPVTGGGSAYPVQVTNFAQLKAAVESSDAKVIHVMNDVGDGYKGTSGDVLNFKSNKTIIGVKAGLTVKCSFQIRGVSNLIIRNLIIRGPGNSNSQQNWDAVCIQGSKRIWFDHCTIMEGEDGNFDVVKGADNVTASWCKFTYVTGGGHNFSNLIGSSNNESISHGKLNVTYAYCWWDNVTSRCPRTRYGKIHVLNSYYNKVGSGAYAGYMSNIRVEGSFFESSVKNPTGLISTDGKAGVFTIDCNVNGTKKDGYNEPFIPPYQYKKYLHSEVKGLVTDPQTGAGATLGNPLSMVNYTLSTAVAQGQGTIAPQSGSHGEGQSITIAATPEIGWLFDRWEGDLSGKTNPSTLTMDGDKNVSAYFVEDTRTYYSVIAQSSPGGTVTTTPPEDQLVEGTTITLTATPNNGWTFAVWSGDNTGSDPTYTINSLSSDISVTTSFLPQDMLLYEAEYGLFHNAGAESDNTGFTGEGYVNFDNEIGSSVDIPVYVDEAGEKILTITFANGSDASRPMSVSVDDTHPIASLSFDATADWTFWQTKQVKLILPQGVSTINLASTGDEGGPNIDKIEIEQSTPILSFEKQEKGTISFQITPQKMLSVRGPSARRAKVSIFSLDGKRVYTNKFSSRYTNKQMNILIGGIRPGMYIIRYEADGLNVTESIHVL